VNFAAKTPTKAVKMRLHIGITLFCMNNYPKHPVGKALGR